MMPTRKRQQDEEPCQHYKVVHEDRPDSGQAHWPSWTRWKAPKLPKWGPRPPVGRGKAKHRRGRR